MDRYPRTVFGYHGTDPAVAERLFRGELALADWRPSANEYDWLGHGIYFWEYGPERAREWAGKGGIVGALITLGECLDLTDVRDTDLLVEAYPTFVKEYRKRRRPLPENRGKRRDLDCAMINFLCTKVRRETGRTIQTVRAAFLEGEPVFPGSAILRETHVQMAVRDVSCILGVFRPTGIPSGESP
jgi:hypothetical protein